MNRALFLLMSAAVVMLVLMVGLAPEAAANDVSPSDTVSSINIDSLTVLAQSSDESSGSSTRIRGRSIRGLISLVVLGAAGVGWVFKKLTGRD